MRAEVAHKCGVGHCGVVGGPCVVGPRVGVAVYCVAVCGGPCLAGRTGVCGGLKERSAGTAKPSVHTAVNGRPVDASAGRLRQSILSLETLIYSVWRTCFTFFETVEDGRVHSCSKKDRALPNEITARFQEALYSVLPFKKG